MPGSAWSAEDSFRVSGPTGDFSVTWTSPEGERSYGLALGDYDGDGDLDQLIGNCFDQANRVYRNDGGGSFTSAWTSRNEH